MTKDDEQKESTKKDNLFVVMFLIGWIAWVVLYLFVFKTVSLLFLFNILELNSFPVISHMIPILFIPDILSISINHIIVGVNKLR